MGRLKGILGNIIGDNVPELRTSKIHKIIIHSTGSRILHKWDSLLLVKLRHKYLRGYSDIGYHALVKRNGKIAKGRDRDCIGAHCFGQNSDSLGFAFIGNLDKIEPTKEQWKSMVDLVAYTCDQYDLESENVYGHNEFTSDKACPGKYVDMDLFREEVEIKQGAYSYRKEAKRPLIYSNPHLRAINY
jgi:hypothetical protein